MTDKLQQYIKDKYDGASDWFVEEVQSVSNQQRVQDVISKKKYLNGEHKILQRQPYKYNGKVVEPRRIVLQYAKTLLNFQKSYLLANKITLTGNEEVVRALNNVNRKGKYDRVNMSILGSVLKYGNMAEYIYVEDGVIKSKLIDPSECYPVYDHENNLIALIQAYMCDGVEYYTVYEKDTVSEYNNAGGTLRMTGRFHNLSGLPIVYKSDNELSNTEGRSELDDWIEILDNMEDLISKYTDSFYRFMNPVPVVIGLDLKGEGLPSDVVGAGIRLDDGGEFRFEGNGLDYKSFETVYKTLLQELLDISQVPAVSMNKTDVSNLSEFSIRLLYSLADVKASINEQYMRDGIEQRHDVIRRLLGYQGVKFTDEQWDSLNMVFQYNTPSNNTEIISNLKELREMGGISLESLLEQSPYTTDIASELQRLGSEKVIAGNDLGNSESRKVETESESKSENVL
ncbi:phage portal protein [Bacillus norwichensis]|uniref:Phage portal protein n=1 Tax=Bacillus norwichensis TaxID=2762217 RepID=A0ABR8VNU0_9BACI|nr:phage portal protein [Bacillus norwichensis]MBD8006417.1 phage portal protein [Bacillus norwichensis]